MEIFKLGDDILALLEMVLGFWNNQINHCSWAWGAVLWCCSL